MNELGLLGIIVSTAAIVAMLASGVIVSRIRKVVRKNTELEDLREMNLAYAGYTFKLEAAAQELCNRLNVELNVPKPEILQRSYLKKKAEEDGNREIQELMMTVDALKEHLSVAGIINFPKKE